MKPYVRKRNGRWYVHTEDKAAFFASMARAQCYAQARASGYSHKGAVHRVSTWALAVAA